jgi:HAE1 family hydrophobic/amphiphilic exporter-1
MNRAFQEAQAIVQETNRAMQNNSVSAIETIAIAADKAEAEYRITIDREQCLRYGIQAGEAARSIAEMTKGKVATTFAEFDKKIDIRVKPISSEQLASEQRTSKQFASSGRTSAQEPSITIEELFRQYIQLPSRGGTNAATASNMASNMSSSNGMLSLPISALARWERTETFREVRREDGLRTVYVVADKKADADLETAVRQMQRIVARRPPLPQGRTSVGGANEEIREAFSVLYAALLISALLMYTVLAVEFESLLFPFIIMFSVPLGLIGAILTLYLAGASLNIVSLMGLVILVGIADNDAVVKVETILAKRRAGLPLREAILAAGQERFRPIVMNSLTVMFGLVPMMLGTGAATQLRTSLSLAVIGGLVSATALTLVVIPVLYALAEKIQNAIKKR